MATPLPQQPPKPRHLCHYILTIDTKFSQYIHTLFHPILPISCLLLLELSGDFRFSFPISVALFLSPVSSVPSLHPFLSSLLLGLLLDLALVGLIKLLFRRPRPLHNHLSSMSAAVSADHFSFPSGHASRVSFLASLLFLSADVSQAVLVEMKKRGGGFGWVSVVEEGEQKRVAEIVVVLVCVWAAMTATSRVLLGRHFVLDVVAGVCLGVLEGLFAFRFLRYENFLRYTKAN